MVLKIILWKEMKDLARDRRTLFAIILLPLLSLPSLGALTVVINRVQPISFAIVLYDKGDVSNVFVESLTEYLKSSASGYGQSISISFFNSTEEALTAKNIDYIVVVPSGFSQNLTNLSRNAYLEGYKRADTARAGTAEAIFYSSISSIANDITLSRVRKLIELSNVSATPETVLNPLRVKQESYVSGGGAAPPNLEQQMDTARIFAFALFFVTTPSVSYIVDSLMGEKERKTLESLLALPVSRKKLLAGKILASSIIGFIAGLADVVGVVTYFFLLSYSYATGSIVLDPGLVALHSIDVALTVFATCALVTPFIIRSGSSRGANLTAATVTGLAMVIFFVALLGDIQALPKPIYYTMLFIPYTNSVLILFSYVQKSLFSLLIHLSLLLSTTAFLYYIAFKLFNTEKLILPPLRERE